MESDDSQGIIKIFEADGWVLINTTDSHAHFKHPVNPGRITLPYPEKNLPLGTLKSITAPSDPQAEAAPSISCYLGLIHKDSDSDFGIMFPDFPGCISAGDTIGEAISMGGEALAGHVALMRRDAENIPPARTLDEIREAEEKWIDWQGAVAIPVPLLPTRG